ncbi:MAG TPA: FAD-dependent monooxygenase [Tepidisphaeraceae bacterium]|jgi:2-polyprenyl-6-methoxyphenol hydroxylase-like FAD-dependent oxidoreductase|nr:FAD-dependent monooxygenase [Tepidisphaeraceae bacterium]
MIRDIDVLIVGAGPTGLMAAIELLRQGVRCRIIDKAAHGSMTSKALAVQARTLEYFDRLGLAGKAVEAGLPLHGLRMFSDRKPVFQFDIDAIHSTYNFILAYPQSATENLLREHLQRQGVAVEFSTELTSFTQDSSGIQAQLNHAGNQQTFGASWLLGCDGAHSIVRHSAQIPFAGHAFEESFALADLKLDWDGPRDRPSIYLHAGRLAAIFPMKGDLWRLVVETPVAETTGDPTIQEFQRALDEWGPPQAKAHDAIWMSRFKISQRQVSTYRNGRVFLAGDAAHIHSPIGGQGMNTGIQDVVNLAWKLALEVHGHAAPALLDTYDAERRLVGQRLLRATGAATKAILSESRLIESVRDMIAHVLLSFGFVRERIQQAVSQIGVNYRTSPIVHEAAPYDPDPKAGDRAPEMPPGSKHLLLCASAANRVGDAVRESYSTHVEIKTSSAGSKSDTILLIRPDGYIGLRCQGGDVDALRRYMSGIVRF